MKITMAWSQITATGKKYVNDVLESGWLSRKKYIPRFEQEVAEKHGAKHGILVNSGTDALRISLATLKEVYRWKDGSGVIVPALTFVATVNAILQNNLKPIFTDIDPFTANLHLADLPGPFVVASLPVHLFGLPAEIPKTELKVIEDSCEAFGVHTLRGEMMCMSFYVSHHVSTGVGGMILTNSKKYEQIARSYQNHGRIDDGTHFQFGRVGYSSRITEMEAALGCAALEHFNTDLVIRRRLARAYIDNLDVAGIPLQIMPDDIRHSWMFYPVLLGQGNRDKLLQHLRTNGIESREAMPLINQPVFKKLYKPGSCPNAENWTKNGLLLPLHPKMTPKDVAVVCRAVKGFYN